MALKYFNFEAVTTAQSTGDDPYVRLSHAIVLQAVDDYRRAMRTLRDEPFLLLGLKGKSRENMRENIAKSRKLIKDCEAFFRSEWFMALTKIDGEDLLKKLKKEWCD